MRFKILAFLLMTTAAHARPGYFEPWGKDSDLCAEATSPTPPAPPASLFVRMAEQAILFHQNVLSPVDGPRSHYRPSSSQYMLLAMRKHGFVKGFVLGCDRLLRENSSAWVYQTIEENGKLIKYDPVP